MGEEDAENANPLISDAEKVAIVVPQVKVAEKDPGEKSEKQNEANGGVGAAVRSGLQHGTRTVCSKHFWKNKFPITKWLPDYNTNFLIGDIIAGLTTALTVIPQGVGYAPLAGLPLQYGLYASIIPGFVYCVFGTTKELTIGPTAVNAIMSFNYAGPDPFRSVTLGFCAGLVEILMGLLNLGFLVKFISGPVISAFSSAVAIQVITSQLKGLFGLHFPGRGFLNIWIGFFVNITSVKISDMVASLISFVILFAVKKLKDCHRCEGSDPNSKRAFIVKKSKWFFGVSVNCILLLFGSVTAYLLLHYNLDILELTGEIESGLPPIQLPWQFGLNATDPDAGVDPIEIVQDLGAGLVMLPLVSTLQHLAIAKHYAGTNKLFASQEVLALGLSQTIGAFVGTLPITASFGRSAVNAASGVKTPFGGIVTGSILILACAMLSPYLAYIPTSVLSAVIIFSMLSTIKYDLPLNLWRSSRQDLVPCLLTFFLGLFLNVESGLIVGTLCHIFILVFYSSAARLTVEKSDDYTVVRPDRGLYYPGVDAVKTKLIRTALECNAMILDLSLVTDIDFSTGGALVDLVGKWVKDKKVVVFCCAFENVYKTLDTMGHQSLVFLPTLEAAQSYVATSV